MAKNKEEKTNVMRTLEQKKIPYTAFSYDPDGPIDGVSVAAETGLDAASVFKFLIAAPSIEPEVSSSNAQDKCPSFVFLIIWSKFNCSLIFNFSFSTTMYIRLHKQKTTSSASNKLSKKHLIHQLSA